MINKKSKDAKPAVILDSKLRIFAKHFTKFFKNLRKNSKFSQFYLSC